MEILDNQKRVGENGKNSLLENTRKAIATVMHPAINRSLMNLGMIQKISLKGHVASVTLLIPFPGIPILSFLKNSLKESVKPLGINLEVNIDLMNKEEVQCFLSIDKKTHKNHV